MLTVAGMGGIVTAMTTQKGNTKLTNKLFGVYLSAELQDILRRKQTEEGRTLTEITERAIRKAFDLPLAPASNKGGAS